MKTRLKPLNICCAPEKIHTGNKTNKNRQTKNPPKIQLKHLSGYSMEA